jgi:large subunit ribosomal protein L10
VKDTVLKRKEAIVSEIEEKISNSHSIVIVDYRGLSVSEVTELRSQFRDNDIDYKVYKNTLMRRAFTNLGHEDMLEYLTGPNAIAFANSDATASAKVTTKFAKENTKLEIKAGLLGDKVLDVDGISKLAKIPTREVLIGKLVGSLSSPISNFVNTTQQLTHTPLRNLIHVAETLAERQGTEAAVE